MASNVTPRNRYGAFLRLVSPQPRPIGREERAAPSAAGSPPDPSADDRIQADSVTSGFALMGLACCVCLLFAGCFATGSVA